MIFFMLVLHLNFDESGLYIFKSNRLIYTNGEH